MKFKESFNEQSFSGDIASIGAPLGRGVSKKGTLKYSHYSDRAGKREYVYASNKAGAQVDLIRRYKTKYPNIYIHVDIKDIKEEH